MFEMIEKYEEFLTNFEAKISKCNVAEMFQQMSGFPQPQYFFAAGSLLTDFGALGTGPSSISFLSVKNFVYHRNLRLTSEGGLPLCSHFDPSNPDAAKSEFYGPTTIISGSNKKGPTKRVQIRKKKT